MNATSESAGTKDPGEHEHEHEEATGSETVAAREPAVADGSLSALGRLARAIRVDLREGTSSEVGMATAEYAVVTLAAAGFAGLLAVILRSNEVRGLLLDIIRGALSG